MLKIISFSIVALFLASCSEDVIPLEARGPMGPRTQDIMKGVPEGLKAATTDVSHVEAIKPAPEE